MLSIRHIATCIVLSLTILTLNVRADGFTDTKPLDNVDVSKTLLPALEHLLTTINNDGSQIPGSDQIGCIIDFVNSSKDPETIYNMGERKGAASSYFEFSINRSLKEVLDRVYNPDIPSHIFTPSSIRWSEWIRVNGEQRQLPKLSGYLKDYVTPVMVKGVEFIENTPDTVSGAYFAYELDRALILTRYQGRMALISISGQRDKSGVGKKGLVLGDDDNWNYLYTGEKGCTKPGLGWVESYMYDSASITVYYEMDGPTPQIRLGMFKWLRAGWAGINMVKPHHIREGAKRFAKPFKHIIESPVLADTGRLSTDLKKIDNLSEAELRHKVRQYFLHLKGLHQDQSRLARKWLDRLTVNDDLLAKMKPQEMKAVLAKAYIKHLLGKSPGIDSSFFSKFSSGAGSAG
jgi:hypothetical protein